MAWSGRQALVRGGLARQRRRGLVRVGREWISMEWQAGSGWAWNGQDGKGTVWLARVGTIRSSGARIGMAGLAEYGRVRHGGTRQV